MDKKMKRETAETVKVQCLVAIRSLHDIFALCSDVETIEIRKPLGILIGRIDFDALDVVYQQYPDLDDLKDKLPT
jgi:hypothetical protein